MRAIRLSLPIAALLVLLPWVTANAAQPPEGGDDVEETPAPMPVLEEKTDPLQERVESLEAEVQALRARVEAQSNPDPVAEPAPAPMVDAPPPVETPPEQPAGSVSGDNGRPPDYADGFHFGSYGRVVASGDGRGRGGRDADIAARGSRMDESSYAELELRREDYWDAVGGYTRAVATLAVAAPLFHYDGDFSANIAMRNLYLEAADFGAKGLSFWAGSRMYRGDDIYVLDYWPLDNLNTLGGGIAYKIKGNTTLKLHGGVAQPRDPFYRQTVARERPHNQPGAAQVNVLDRVRAVGSLRASHVFSVGDTGGIKLVAYGEGHHVAAGQRDEDFREFEALPADYGLVAGGEISAFTGKRSTHLNLWVRHAWGLAAHGDFAAPNQLGLDKTTRGASELVVALGGNWEKGPFGLMLGSYYRRFRNASEALDYDDVNEGVVLLRPQVWFAKVFGVALEGSFQAVERGALTAADGSTALESVRGQLLRFGIMPFLSPGGRGAYTRPQIRLMYLLTVRDAGARSLYPRDDVFGLRNLDHFVGLGAEWWFGSTSYFRD